MRVLFIPIEPLEERYSVQWDKWFHQQFSEAGIQGATIYGNPTSGKINNGSFLDVVETNLYKTSQLLQILEELKNYDDKEKLVIFFMDLWFPGLETIAYIREGLGLKNLHICGCLHAGSYDKHDFLNKRGMTPWAHPLEYSWFNGIIDKIFVATEYHKQLLINTRVDNNPEERIVVTGFPIYDDFSDVQPIPNDEPDIPIIVFPHRLDSEKNPQMFDELAKRFPNYKFIKSKETCKTKKEYYRLLRSADIAVSFADQETWGIAMQEAVICGCIPLCPDRLSYSEMYNDHFLYNTFEACVNKLDFILSETVNYEIEFRQTRYNLLQSGKQAIPNMIEEIKKL